MRNLSRTESQIMLLVAQGFSAAEIAEARPRTAYTIKTQLQTILRKLHARNRAHAVALWLASGGFQEAVQAPVEVRVLGITEGETRLVGDFSHGVTLLDRGGRLIARCRQCAVTEWIGDSAVLVAFNDKHGEHVGVKASA